MNETVWQSSFDFPVVLQNITFNQELFQASLVVVGTLLNSTIVFVVSFSRQLRYPRHVFWAAISFVECIFLIQCALELTVMLNQNYLACRLYVILASVDYSILLLLLSLAAFDRYLAIVRYEWYKKSVTNRGVLFVIVIASVLTFVTITSPFWTGYKSIYTCTLNLTHVHWVLAWNLFLGMLCVVLHYKIFRKTKTLIQEYVPNYRRTSITVRFVNSSMRPSHASSGRQIDASSGAQKIFAVFLEHPSVHNQTTCLPSGEAEIKSYVDHIDNECFSWTPNRSKVNRLEVRAALSMSVNILPFWICTFPVSCNVMSLYWCVRLKYQCDFIDNSWQYLWNLFMLHSVYNPVMYMTTSYEFRRAFVHITKKLMNILRVHGH
ncbi:hypothetical protein GHT06_015599 [Daphnia sinensis]|uniref:G-protein coupled receptors family 1 profile domain-containing protein n=1 Tax=Daphnia sinensis TaxID=1820382 RepID=A0AAD5PXD3_9CRUS|nr:hypothetical protein GHT06_015599 [Daphnia sinensis]